MRFILDENVPASVLRTLRQAGHAVESIAEHVPRGAPDPLIAVLSEQLDAVLVSFDGDFQTIAPRVPRGERTRFRRLSRIWLRCNEYQAAQRIEAALQLVEAEFALVTTGRLPRMLIWLASSYIRTER